MLLVALFACVGGSLTTKDGNYALSFDGEGCATVPLDAQAFTTPLTIEATLRGATDPAYGTKPLLAWSDTLLLAELEDGRVWYGDPDVEGHASVIDVSGVMDGELHHLAGTWDEEGKLTLWKDGVRIGFATVDPPATGGDRLEIGCWSDEGAFFEGLIDEVRISSVVRYEEDFEPDFTPYEVDADTTALWHMDEGEGLIIVDETGNYDGQLVEVEYEAFEVDE